MLHKLLLIFIICFYRIVARIAPVLLLNTKKREKSVLYLCAFFPENAGYEWRVHKWKTLLEKQGFTVSIKHALSKTDFYALKESNTPLFLIKFLRNRFRQVIQAAKYEHVIVRRELLLYNDYGNLFLDRLLLKINPKAILDFDDDIAYAKNEPRPISTWYGKLLQENGAKFTQSLKLYAYFITGSHYLKEYTLAINKKITEEHILVLPTCVDYEKHTPKTYDLSKEAITFGWVGGNHNLFLLDTIIPALNKISKQYTIELLVIAGKEYFHNDAQFNIKNEPWSLATEIASIRRIDIGLMPLKFTPRDQGKCSFKLIQYMGLGVVSIATNVGMNKEVITAEKQEGFLTDNEWEETIKKVIESKQQWSEIGKRARQKVLDKYTFEPNIRQLNQFLTNINLK